MGESMTCSKSEVLVRVHVPRCVIATKVEQWAFNPRDQGSIPVTIKSPRMINWLDHKDFQSRDEGLTPPEGVLKRESSKAVLRLPCKQESGVQIPSSTVKDKDKIII